MSKNLTNLKTKEKLKPKKAFMHWFFQEGLDEKEILHAKENIEALVQEYKKLEKDSDKNIKQDFEDSCSENKNDTETNLDV